MKQNWYNFLVGIVFIILTKLCSGFWRSRINVSWEVLPNILTKFCSVFWRISTKSGRILLNTLTSPSQEFDEIIIRYLFRSPKESCLGFRWNGVQCSVQDSDSSNYGSDSKKSGRKRCSERNKLQSGEMKLPNAHRVTSRQSCKKQCLNQGFQGSWP